jgi:hypothetical protein
MVLEKLNLTCLEVIVCVCTQMMLNTLGEIHESILICPLKKTFKNEDYYSQDSKENG